MDLNPLRDRLRARLPDVIGDLRARARAAGVDVQREAGYTIRNADTDEAVIRIYDEIWWLGVNALDFAADLDKVTAPAIRVEINSPGGDVFDGIAIYNALRNHPAHVTTRVDGIAASIASVIAQAGDRRIMQPSGQMMIHNAWGMTVGDNRDHDDMASILRQQDAVIAGIYAARSGQPIDRFRELMDSETWLTAETAVAEGLADEIVEPAPKAASQRTLHDQISEAMAVVTEVITSAERVDALRAGAGKGLSNRNNEGLAGLRDAVDQLTGLLDEAPAVVDPEAPIPPEVADQLARLYGRRAGRPSLTGV
jgi:ATP-dependent Clp endopeptidase proteolytic subunit ClpP